MKPLQAELTLVIAARAGDKQAFGQLVEQYEYMASQLALRLVGDPEMARELTQEAMLQAYLSLPQLSHAHKFASWLYGIVLNVCRNYRRTRKANFLSLEALSGGLHFDALPYSSSEPGPQEIAEIREFSAEVLATVNVLSPKNRQVTLLFYYEQLRMDEIAALLGISVTTVKGRLHKSRAQLRALLAPVYSPVDGKVAAQERKASMAKVTIADVVHQEENDKFVIVLLDETGQRLLPIWIGPFEADAIAMHLLNQSLSRPPTYEFIARILAATGTTLEEVRVEVLKEITYYAVAKLRTGSTVQEIDARPSDAIALALRTNSPIYVAEEVMAKSGVMIPAEFKKIPLGKSLATVAQQIEQQRQAIEQKLQETKEEEANKGQAERDEARQKLLSYLFGSDG
jgi:RNA polymerase sigma factor (sigma-70 family)